MAYTAARLFSTVVTQTFFRDIQVIGQENIPKDGPLLLFGNHNNQFIDPLVLIFIKESQLFQIFQGKFILQQQPNMKRPIIGHLGKALGGIPVERPQDLSKRGFGTIQRIDGNIVYGLRTEFKSQCKINDILVANEQEFQIVEIISDTQLKINNNGQLDSPIRNLQYKIQPKIDQSNMFEQVWIELSKGACIGIFPEGGSHDQTRLLPLKPGICIMALGASQKFNTKVKLQPVGLNYFKGHKFRSKVIIEFGVPYEVSQELIDLYAKNKREAISNLLYEIESQLKTVTIQAPTYSDLSAVMIVRSLYLPDKARLSPQDNLELVKRFSSAFYKLENHPEVKEVVSQVKMYNYKLKALGVYDYQVMRMEKNTIMDIYKIAFDLFMALFSLSFALPGYIMTIPISILLNTYTERERQKALANSKVKLSGKDVIASYKILASIMIVPAAIAIYTVLFHYALKKWNFISKEKQLKLTLIFFLLWPFYITAMIRSNDGLIRHSRKVKSQILFFLYQSKYRKLKKQREQLQDKIRKMVDMLGENVVADFTKKRVFSFDTKKDKLDIDNVFCSLEELGI
ncbi:unnamed protein product [Paramecium sonneborni]|uniref:Phospholipid/glycerol acyltransferase domain-containing protein n=1 Tax=Paramecium sonneborni TaxID=65129 RepID=A0A8S1QDC0_9CILI|nr:unnamed protein product [Paramecium sonneborni]